MIQNDLHAFCAVVTILVSIPIPIPALFG
ncbi:hypothetical protein BL107_15175 [Synechococcus sp. BL107]|nr:hypothetical protein BL107_15175 [Synechococcus sp. BL107]